MSLSQVKVSEKNVLDALNATTKGYITVAELCAAHECSDHAARIKLMRLVAKGVLDFTINTVSRYRERRYFYGDGRSKLEQKPAYTPEVKGVDIVPPFKTNIWTKPLSGYERSLRDAAARCLAGR